MTRILWSINAAIFSTLFTLSSIQQTTTYSFFGQRQERHKSTTFLSKRNAEESVGLSNNDLISKDCSFRTLNPPILSFIDDESPRIIYNTNNRNVRNKFECQRIFECKVLSSPPEVNVLWYFNKRIIKVTSLENSAVNNTKKLFAADESTNNIDYSVNQLSPMIGLSQMTHRLCLDPYVLKNRHNSFQCKIESMCYPNLSIQSKKVVLEMPRFSRPWIRQNGNRNNDKRNLNQMNLSIDKNNMRSNKTALIIKPELKNTAPLITMITSTRMELVGRDVQISCHAAGSPRPNITWSVIDDMNEDISYPIEDFPFIETIANGDIIITSSKANLASVTLKCEARNPFGRDHDTSTIILVDE